MSKENKAYLTNPIDYINQHFSNKEIFRFILTHPDMDHMSGIKSLFTKKYVRNFWDVPNNKPDPENWDQSPYDKNDWDFYQNLRAGKISNKTIVRPLRDQTAECCWVQDGIKILSPNKELIDEAEKNEEYDHLSYVLQITYNEIKVMLTGDATKNALDDIVRNYNRNDLKSSILLAPGHGSKNHVSKDFLDAVDPKLIIVSVAEGIDYDYDTYKNYGTVLSTKYYGNVRLKIKDNGKIFFRTQFQNYSDNWYDL
ncbi:ComEC/Rec2 family competence protein [Rosettibacter firmus]|uniref:ComEC/Rec2 family competence protein n=1 Tax=Rosettibacter firmus TaxID=3111522 RepID=UPI00336C05D9